MIYIIKYYAQLGLVTWKGIYTKSIAFCKITQDLIKTHHSNTTMPNITEDNGHPNKSAGLC